MLVTCWNCEGMVVLEPGEYRCPECNTVITREERGLDPPWMGKTDA